MKFDDEFKIALKHLPEIEKDKLILRLLKHDLQLANRLHFELVNTDSVESKRVDLEKQIVRYVKNATDHYYSPGYLLMAMRDISGRINEHVSITKDKFGEISLNCLMLRHVLALNNFHLNKEPDKKCRTLYIYLVARIFKILILIKKQHEDLLIEFQKDIETIGKHFGDNQNLMMTAIHNGLDINWLVQFSIPSNISSIHKKLRNNGYLK